MKYKIIARPRNSEYNNLWSELNNYVEEVEELEKQFPKITDLKKLGRINQSHEIGSISKRVDESRQKFTQLHGRGTIFMVNPLFDFPEKDDFDYTLSVTHHLNLLTLRLNYAERCYYDMVSNIQRIEDYIHKHNSQIDSDRSLRYGRVSIYLGIVGIVLGIASQNWSCSERSIENNIVLDQGVVPISGDSLGNDTLPEIKPDSSGVEIDTTKGE